MPCRGIDRIVHSIEKNNIECGLLQQDSLFLGIGKGGKARSVLIPPGVYRELVDLKVNGKFGDRVFPITTRRVGFIVKAAAKAAGAATINYGLFLNTVIDFIIVAFIIFLVVKQVNRLRRPGAAPPPPSTKDCTFCFTNIPLKATRCPNCTSQLA